MPIGAGLSIWCPRATHPTRCQTHTRRSQPQTPHSAAQKTCADLQVISPLRRRMNSERLPHQYNATYGSPHLGCAESRPFLLIANFNANSEPTTVKSQPTFRRTTRKQSNLRLTKVNHVRNRFVFYYRVKNAGEGQGGGGGRVHPTPCQAPVITPTHLNRS